MLVHQHFNVSKLKLVHRPNSKKIERKSIIFTKQSNAAKLHMKRISGEQQKIENTDFFMSIERYN